MKKFVVLLALGALGFSGLALGGSAGLAWAAELDGFAINTQEKNVTITLFTDKKVSYTTEKEGKQFTIVIPDAELSQEQINNGLPVVIDNKNRFIGRAVPAEDGKVKVILPNLSAQDFSVSVQQKRSSGATSTVESTASLKPRPAISSAPTSQFEQVAANFPKPEPAESTPDKSASSRSNQGSKLKLVPVTRQASSTHNGQAIWNPYVVKPSPEPKPTPRMASKLSATNNTAINTISVADSFHSAPPATASSPTGHDPLWYLHSLPPANPAELPADTLAGPALSQLPGISTNDAASAPAQAAPAQPSGSILKTLQQEIKNAVTSLPKWLIITIAAFFGGIGLFATIGGLVLLRVLFSQTQQNFAPQAWLNLPQGIPLFVSPTNLQPQASSADSPKTTAYGSKPAVPAIFQDKASVRSVEFLKDSPLSMAQVIQNASLVKFPNQRQQRRVGGKRGVNQPGLTSSGYQR